jgi:hypothetical protein
MNDSREDRRRLWRRNVRAAWVARADDARVRRMVRDELGVIADRRDADEIVRPLRSTG